MNNSVIKQYIFISIFPFLFSCASKTIRVVQVNAEQKSIPNIIEETICSLTTLPSYSSEMKSGDEFVLIIFPGFTFSALDNLSFVNSSGNDLIGNLKATDNAYRFAKFVNKIIIPSHLYHESGMLLGDYFSRVIQEPSENNLTLYDVEDMNSFKLTSPTYNDDFYFTTVNSFSNNLDDSWTKFNKSVNQIDSIQSAKKKHEILFPVYNFSGSFVRLNIERPWFRPSVRQGIDDTGANDLAMIKGLILAKDLNIDEYSASNKMVRFSKNGKIEIKKTTPTSSMRTNSTLIIGFICRLL